MIRIVFVTSVVRQSPSGSAVSAHPPGWYLQSQGLRDLAIGGQGAAASVFAKTGRQPNASTMTSAVFPASTINRLIAGTI